MTNNSSIIEIDIPASDWEYAVRLYTRIFSLGKGETSGTTLIFRQTDLEIRLTKVGDDQKISTAKPTRYTRVKGPDPLKSVTRVYQQFLDSDPDAFSILEPHEALGGPSNKKVILAYVGFGDPCEIGKPLSRQVSRIECVIHNPDWS